MALRSLTGLVVDIDGDEVVVRMLGLGFAFKASRSALEAAGRALGSGAEQTFFVEPVFAQDGGLSLYGFERDEERRLFCKLAGIQGISRSSALGVLSLGTLDDVLEILRSGDEFRLKRAPHVGPKSAKRILSEFAGSAQTSLVQVRNGGAAGEVASALRNLGYAEAEISRALSSIGHVSDAQEGLRRALAAIQR